MLLLGNKWLPFRIDIQPDLQANQVSLDESQYQYQLSRLGLTCGTDIVIFALIFIRLTFYLVGPLHCFGADKLML